MKLYDLRPPVGSKKKRKRVGRGPGSGHGKTSCRGHKGQKARSGGRCKPWFEGGQMPLQRRLPKRGFTNIFKERFAIINIKDLNRFEKETSVTPVLMKEKGLIKRLCCVKILGEGELARPLTVQANYFSKSAVKKIEVAGGKAVRVRSWELGVGEE
ncbi:MAG: 50S ribosomal protein L15 [Nitrospinae bacterium]|nr:50S ribosomal protein L15 [Nitrospinota bacterium]